MSVSKTLIDTDACADSLVIALTESRRLTPPASFMLLYVQLPEHCWLYLDSSKLGAEMHIWQQCYFLPTELGDPTSQGREDRDHKVRARLWETKEMEGREKLQD
jgi:hypothetical protein